MITVSTSGTEKQADPLGFGGNARAFSAGFFFRPLARYAMREAKPQATATGGRCPDCIEITGSPPFRARWVEEGLCQITHRTPGGAVGWTSLPLGVLKSGIWRHCRDVACPLSPREVYGRDVVVVRSGEERVSLTSPITLPLGFGGSGKGGIGGEVSSLGYLRCGLPEMDLSG